MNSSTTNTPTSPSEFSTPLQLAFIISVVAMAGSLFFSEVMKLPPCVLCWYQRICMYPLVVIFGLGLLKTGRDCWIYAKVLVGLGLIIAAYHNLLYYKIIPDSITPCTQGISCTSKQLEWLGFITIPLLSLGAFLALTVLIFINSRNKKQEVL